jgi:hypothetical protein
MDLRLYMRQVSLLSTSFALTDSYERLLLGAVLVRTQKRANPEYSNEGLSTASVHRDDDVLSQTVLEHLMLVVPCRRQERGRRCVARSHRY